MFCRCTGRNLLAFTEELAIPAAYIMGVGRIGNFIDGQIVGSITDVWWAVKFPDAEGFHHPVVLYDGLKNLLLVPFLLLIRRSRPPRGVVFGHFILWYGFLRIFVDFFREYRTDFLSFPPGQEFNVIMTVLGLGLLVWAYRRRKAEAGDETASVRPVADRGARSNRMWVKRTVFALLLLFPLIIPSDWTQDVPLRYGKRHAGLHHSTLYPRIQAAANGE